MIRSLDEQTTLIHLMAWRCEAKNISCANADPKIWHTHGPYENKRVNTDYRKFKMPFVIISQHWYSYWPDDLRQQAISCANGDQELRSTHVQETSKMLNHGKFIQFIY